MIEKITGERESSSKANVSVQAFMTMMDVADALRKQRKEVEKQLNLDEQVADIKNRLVATYKASGIEVSDEILDTAIKDHFSGLYSFKEPIKDFRYKLAELYIDRKRIGKKYGIPLAVASGISIAAFVGAGIFTSIQEAQNEKDTEISAQREYDKRIVIKNKIDEISPESLIIQLTKEDIAELSTIVQNSRTKLKTLDDYFGSFCPKGNCQEKITIKNYKEAARRLVTEVNPMLSNIITNIEYGKRIIDTQGIIISEKKKLEVLIKEIKNSKVPLVFTEKAQEAYLNASAMLDKRLVKEAQEHISRLINIRNDAKEFAILSSSIETLYSSIKTISKEDKALQTGTALYKEANQYVRSAQYIQSVNLEGFRESTNALKELEANLNQEYRLIIAGGKWRYPKNKPNDESAKNYYILVEAKDKNGKLLTKKIRNEETNTVEDVTKWGELVPKAVYERVKRDKEDNGVINDYLFGIKKRGYLTEEIIFKGVENNQQRGQITRW